MRKGSFLLLSITILVFVSAAKLQAQISLFSRASLRSLVQETLRYAWELYFAHKDNYGSEDLWAFRQLAIGLSKVGWFDEAVRVLKAMPKPTKTIAQSQYWGAYREVALIAAKTGNSNLAKQLVAQIPNFVGFFKEPTGGMQKSSVVAAIAQNLEKLPPNKARQRLKEAILIANQINDNFWRGNSLSALAKVAVKFSPKEAKALSVQVLAITEKCSSDNQRLNLLISIAPVINHWSTHQAKQIFEQAMQIALMKIQKQDEKNWSIWWVIQGMVEAGLWDEAIKAANLLPEIKPKLRSDIPYCSQILAPLPPTKWKR